jgi:MFS family permease
VKVHRGVLFLGLASFATDLASEMIYPILPVFFTEVLGTGVLFLGLFEGTAECVASVTKYFAGAASDRAKKREGFVLAGYVVANGLRPLIGLVTAPWQALLLRALDRVGKGVRTSPRDAWMAQMAKASERGMVYGFHRAMDHAGATLGPLVATAFLLAWPGAYRSLFLWTLVPGLLAAVFILCAARAFPSFPEADPAPAAGLSWMPGPLKSYLALTALFTLGMASDAFLLLKLKMVGVPVAMIPVLWAALHVVKSSSSAVGGRVSDVFGRKTTILAGWILYTLFYAAFGGVEDRGLMVALFLLYGTFYGLTEAPEKALVADLAPAERRGRAFGLYHMVVGLGSLPASLLFGVLWESFGAPTAFYTVAAISLVSCGLLAGTDLDAAPPRKSR